MYNFIDVNGTSTGNTLPAEALKINGAYIENQIAGYRTLSVSGREALSPELTTYETGARDGSTLQSKRFPARTITVQFQLIAASDAAFRSAFNQLGKILNVENAELIFADELDKFFTGTPSAISDIEPGRNAVKGEFTLYCADPLKYSVTEHTVTVPAGENSVAFEYNGTYRSYPVLEADFYKESEISADGGTYTALTGNGDCGYVAFFDEEKNIIQIGDPDEADEADIAERSQTLISQEFLTSPAWSSMAQGLWSINNGIVLTGNAVQLGSLGMSASPYYLKALNYGTSTGMWHGPSITRTIPADSSGDVGASNFLVYYRHKMCIGSAADSVNQFGDFQVQLSDANGKVIAGARVCKWYSGKTGEVMFYVNNTKVKAVNIDLSYGNALTGRDEASIPTSWIRKTGSEIVFNMIGLRYVFVDTSLINAEATKMTIMFGAYSGKPTMSYNGLFWMKFVKQNCNTYVDVPNKFGANDILTADCKSGDIRLNGVPSPELGALGNDWEGFCLHPGLNQIGVAYSDWVPSGYAPTFEIRYREAFL